VNPDSPNSTAELPPLKSQILSRNWPKKTSVSSDVCIEPELLPIDGEVFTGASSYTQDSARLDIAANGFWGGRFERTFFEVRVFNPLINTPVVTESTSWKRS